MSNVVCAFCASRNNYETFSDIIFDWNEEETEIKKYSGITCRCCGAGIPIEEYQTKQKAEIHEKNDNNSDYGHDDSGGGI